MKKFFDKQPVLFAVMWIVVYVIGMSALQSVSEQMGSPELCEAIFCGVLTVLLLIFIAKYKLFAYVGLKRSEVGILRMLIYIPFILVALTKLFLGTGFVFGTTLILRTVKMFFVGFVEEIIFRAFLFKGIVKENNLTLAVIISSITFGAGHIINLIFNGYTGLESITQIVFAIACGFMLVMVYLRTDSLIACVIFHSVNNMATGYSDLHILYGWLDKDTAEIVMCGVYVVIMLLYTLYVTKFLPKIKPRMDY